MTNITLAQINPSVNKIDDNTQKIIQTIQQNPTDIIVFPEMVVTGYPLEDLVFSDELQKEASQAQEKIIANIDKKTTAIFGNLQKNKEYSKPFNTVVTKHENTILTSTKKALPTYSVFDENRLFTHDDSRIIRFVKNNIKFAVLICEEAWDKSGISYHQLKDGFQDVVIVVNGSPFETNKKQTRIHVMKDVLQTAQAKLGMYVNLVGGQDDIVFDGASFIINKHGIVAHMKDFEEDVQTFNVEELMKTNNTVTLIDEVEAGEKYKASVLGLRDYVQKNNMRSVVIGVSGGIDSAIVASIAADAIGGDNVYGVSMPSQYSSDGSVTDAETLMKNIGGHYRQIPIKDMFDAFMGNIVLENIAMENLQARIRGTILMGISNQEHRLVLAPGNKSELAVGYSTIYGDAVGGYAPIKDAYKTDVYKMAVWRNQQQDSPIPIDSITKPPSAELAPGQVDQDSLPDYDVLDAFLNAHIEQRQDADSLVISFGNNLTQELIKKINRAEWKRRQYPIGPKLTTLSFGRERFVPITR